MDFGIFNAPYSLAYAAGERSLRETIEWDLQVTRWADEYGIAESFYAEHYTIGHEPNPAPELTVAAAAVQTENIKLGALGHVLPYHNPANLAHRLMYLDHLTNGRYLAGFAPGGFPTDAQLFCTGENNGEMMLEALDIIHAVWTKEPPFKFEGKYWNVDMPEYAENWAGPHMRPLQDPHPEMLLPGMQERSPSLTEAARRSLSPMSQQVSTPVMTQHWETIAEVSEENGLTPDRRKWRILRDIFVAETDEEARKIAIEGPQGHIWDTHILPFFKTVVLSGGANLAGLIGNPGMDLDDLTAEWLADNFWLVGSPATVADKVVALNDELGGVGAIVTQMYDFSQDPETHRRSLELLGRDVAARVAQVGARAEVAA